MKRVVINIRASKNISGLVKILVTSPAGLIKFFLNVEPCSLKSSVLHSFFYYKSMIKYRNCHPF